MQPSPATLKKCILAARDLLHRSLHPQYPPVDVEQIARSLGFQIVRIQSVGDELSGLVTLKHKLVGVNGNHHRRRQRFTIAHELGHIALGHPPESRCSIREIACFNREADTFASELLIPTYFLLRYTKSRPYSLLSLARLFDVSEEAMRLRLNLEEVS